MVAPQIYTLCKRQPNYLTIYRVFQHLSSNTYNHITKRVVSVTCHTSVSCIFVPDHFYLILKLAKAYHHGKPFLFDG